MISVVADSSWIRWHMRRPGSYTKEPLSRLSFSSVILWRNALQYLTDSALLRLLVCAESQFDSFNSLRRELLELKREGRVKKE